MTYNRTASVQCKTCKRARHPSLRRWGLHLAERLRDGYRYSFLLSCVTSISTPSYCCPVHSICIISTSTNNSFRGISKYVRGQDTGTAVKCKIYKRSRHPELGRWGLSQAERLRDGYRYSFLLSCVTPISTYSFLLSSAFINCCDREMGFGAMKLLIDVIL